ncbi:MAG: fused response regulator/phosphatase [Pseudomonadales bacterium]|nr:fused response regulator/phosphatase [Pseudomonadales bacterium]
MKILIVDDTEANRELLGWVLEDQGHTLCYACNGKEAVERFETDSPDLILLDIMMPVMDGFEAAQIIKSKSQDRHIPIIFLTAVTDEDALAKGLAVGGDDFMLKPFSETILQAKIKAHSRIRELNDLVTSKNRELTSYKNIIENEYNVAEHVFQSALKRNQLDYSHIEHFLSPATTFSGDLLLASPGPSGSMYYLMADFTGHGLPAAIGAVPLSQRFFELAEWGGSIGNMAKSINQSLLDILPDTMFCAATLVEQKANGEDFIVWTGGLPDAYIITATGDICHQLRSDHMPLGVLEDNEFEVDVHILKLEEGSSLFISTDGLIEAVNEEDAMFGEDRLISLLTEEQQCTINDIVATHETFMGSATPDDDVTLLRITSQPLPEFATTETYRIQSAHIPWKISSLLNADALQLTNPVDELIEMVSSYSGVSQHRDYLHTIISELFNNALEHGVLNLDSKQKQTDKGYLEYYEEREVRLNDLKLAEITVEIEHSQNESNVIKITVTNSGAGFDYEHIPPFSDNDSYGRGIPLVRSLCQGMEFSDQGRRVDVFYSLQ